MTRFWACLYCFATLVGRVAPTGIGRLGPRIAWQVARILTTDAAATSRRVP